MKKLFSIVLLLAAAGSAFSIGLSAGIGGSVSVFSYNEGMSGSYLGTTDSATYTLTQIPFSAKVFLDATFLQLEAGYRVAQGGNQSTTQTGALSFSNGSAYDASYLTFAGYLKFPFRAGSVSVFPLLGAEYDYNLTLTDTNGNDLKPLLTSQELADLNQLWLKGGAGFDLSFGSFYLRPELLAGFKLLSPTDNSTITGLENYVTSSGYSNASGSVIWWTWDLDLLVGFTL